jgi:hypothetical protein
MKPGMHHKIPSITLVMENTVSPRHISTVQEALETLLDHWPVDDGEKYLTAVHVCLDAIHDRVDAEAIRDVMVKAAEEAGVSVLQGEIETISAQRPAIPPWKTRSLFGMMGKYRTIRRCE